MYKMKSVIVKKGVHEDTDGNLVIPVIGLPFGGPVKGADLEGDYFDEHTETGDLEKVFSYFDHGEDSRWLQQYGLSEEEAKSIGFGNSPIGRAVKTGKTADGILYNIIVDRRHRYKQLLRRLAEEGILDASSRALERENDPERPGRVKRWDLAAVDLTITPANPHANVQKNTGVVDMPEPTATPVAEGENTPTDAKPTDPVEVPDGPQPGTEEQPQNGSEPKAEEEKPAATAETDEKPENSADSTPATETEKSEEKSVSATSALAGIFNKSTDVDEQPEENTDESPVQELTNLLKSINENLEKLMGKIEEQDNRLKSVEGIASDLQTALPILGREIAKAVSGDLSAEAVKSNLERGAEVKVKSTLTNGANGSNNPFPPSAPGS